MGFRYQLRTATGDDLGQASYAMQIQPGDVIHINGPERARVTAVVPAELAAEYVDDVEDGILEIEPL